jgi:hypothetical protein
MDQVLCEALLLSDPEALFGAGRERPLEYREGKLLAPEAADVPEPTVDAPGPQQ